MWLDCLIFCDYGFSVSALSCGRRQWHPTPVLLPGKSHGLRSLVGCSLWVRWELDTTEWLTFHFSLSSIGEGNGNPLQFTYLENPRDGGAWWAAIYGVTQSRTRLKWLSSSSSSSPLMPSCNTYHLTWVLLPWTWSNCQHLLDHGKSKRVPEKHLFLLYWLCQSLWLCGSQ